MNKNSNALLKLVKELKLPIDFNEARNHVEKLSDLEVRLLIEKYQRIKDYQDKMDSVARKADPKKYSEIEKEHNEKIEKLDSEHRQKMEKIQEEEDKELETIEKEAIKEIDDNQKKSESEIDQLGNARSDLYSHLNSAIKSK